MTEVRIAAPNGNLGSGFQASTWAHVIEQRPHVIACDSGSTDNGPAYLGSDKPLFTRQMYRHDLEQILAGARTLEVPVIIGSAGGAGTNTGVDRLSELVRDISSEAGATPRIARIYAEQDPVALLEAHGAGRVAELWPSLGTDTADAIQRSTRIVAMMGPEPIVSALSSGADVVIAGRASDSALFAAYPLLVGRPAAQAWHAGKILECGAAATAQRLVPDCLMGAVDDAGFEVWSPSDDMRCTPGSVAAHSLYENADPFRLPEPGGTLTTDHCRYEETSPGRIRVTGSVFEPEPYTVKLEGVHRVGAQAVAMVGIHDPLILEDLDHFLDTVEQRARLKVAESSGLDPSSYQIVRHAYGRDAIMGAREPAAGIPHEVGLLYKVFADTAEAAEHILSILFYVGLHNAVEGWTGMVTNLAVPYSPVVLDAGDTFGFSLNHVLAVDDPCAPFVTVID